VKLRDEGATHAVRTDFTDCFDRLDRTRLIEELELRLAHEDCHEVVDLITAFMNRPVRHRGQLLHMATGVPQGGPLSPLLCNLLLSRFDDAMVGRGWPAIRYADDVVVATKSSDEAAQALMVATEEAARLSLDLSETKTVVREFSEGFVFLGEDVNHKYPENLPYELRPVPDHRTLYVGRQGSMVRLKSGQLIVEHKKQILVSIPSSLVSQIVLFGSVMVTPAVTAEASRSGWSVVYLTRNGWLHSWLEGPKPARAALRRSQYRLGDDPEFRVMLARRFVATKIANQRALLARYVRKTSLPQVMGAVSWLAEARVNALQCEQMDELLGIEGSAARIYFNAFGQLLPDWCEFQGRTRNPPTDPANAALSYLYTILMSNMVAAALAAGLDPAAGFLHTDSGRRPSLACDLVEEFRPLVVDTICLELFRRKSLKPEQFVPGEAANSVFMKTSARKKVTSALEDRMLTVFAHVPSGQRVSYRRACFLQAQQVATCVRTGEIDYQGVSWR